MATRMYAPILSTKKAFRKSSKEKQPKDLYSYIQPFLLLPTY